MSDAHPTYLASPVCYTLSDLQGMAVSSEGFVAVLTSKETARALKLVITPDDPMSGGLDVEQAETSEARTLLQLMQVRLLGTAPLHPPRLAFLTYAATMIAFCFFARAVTTFWWCPVPVV